ncbi:MAG TPA: gamma carbonic anhydrase family protein [Burkholderiales bacterium]|nr:gamma carbonic anhydrase family protein [Burkholderiales bacterium]
MALYQLGDDAPTIHDSAFVAPEAAVIGRVTLGARSSVWPGAVLRGDNEPIRLGEGVNVQDGAVLHVDAGFPLVLEDNVSIGHQAMLHGCTIGEGTLIGIQAIVMNSARIGKYCLVAAGAIVTEGKVFPDRSLILGVPARVVRPLTDEEVAMLRESAAIYDGHRATYKAKLKRIA